MKGFLFASRFTILCVTALATACVSQDQTDSLVGAARVSTSVSSNVQALLVSTNTSVLFGPVTLGSNTTQTINILNAGDRIAQIDTLSFGLIAFTATSDLCSGTSLTSGNSCTITVRYAPSATGAQSSTLTLAYHDSSSSASLVIPVSGTGAVQVPVLTSAPSSNNFGTVTVGSNSSQTFVIANANLTGAIMDVATVSGTGFSITSDACLSNTITSGTAACNVVVRFAPVVVGTVLGQLTLNYHVTGGTSYAVTVSLAGVGGGVNPDLTFSESPYNYGSVGTNTTSSHVFTVTNNTSASATLGVLSISGTSYSVTAQNCNSVVLNPAASCTITVLFSPLSNASFPGTLTIPFANSLGASFSKSDTLSGTGVTPSTSFSFSGFTGVAGTDSTGLTATGVTLSWTAQTAASYYRVTRTGGGTVISGNLTPTSIATYNASGMAPNTNYQFKVNAFDALGVSDGNNNWVSITTPNVTGSTFNGWSDIVSLGSVYTDVGLVDTANSRTGTNRFDRNLNAVAGFGSSDIDVVTGNITVIANTFATGQKVSFATDGAAPSGLTNSTTYYVISIDSVTLALASSAANAVAGTKVVPSSAGSGNMTLMPFGVIKLGWDAFTLTPSGTPTSYNIYRSTISGGAYTLIGTSTTQSYTDNEVSNSTNYYYKVQPFLGNEITAAATSDSIIQVFVPSQNMVSVHRWIANREACTNLLGFTYSTGVNRADNYSCAYTWGTGYAPNTVYNKSKWDIGYSLVIDRWQNGCKMGAYSGSYGTAAPAAGLGAAGNVYFITGASSCYIKDASLGWVAENTNLTNAQRAAIRTNYPGYSPSQIYQAAANSSCQQRSPAGVVDGNGSSKLRLIRMYEMTIAKAVQGINVNNRSAVVLANIFNGANLPANGSCNIPLNNNSGWFNGVSTPVTSSFPNVTGALINGTYLTRSCYGKYQISDLWSGSPEWTGSQFFVPGSGSSYFIQSSTDAGDNLIENYLVDNTMAITNFFPESTTPTVNMLPLFGVISSTVSTSLGTRSLSYASVDYGNVYFQFVGASGGINGIYSGGSDYTARGVGASSRFGFRVRIATATVGEVYGTFGLNNRCVGQAGP